MNPTPESPHSFDPLRDLPRLGDEALSPCMICRRPITGTGRPVFYRLNVQYCGLHAKAIMERGGLAMMLGSIVLADAMGAHAAPVVEMTRGTANLCLSCAQESIERVALVHQVLEHEDD